MRDWRVILFGFCTFFFGAAFCYVCVRALVRNAYDFFRKIRRPRTLVAASVNRRDEFQDAIAPILLWLLLVASLYALRCVW